MRCYNVFMVNTTHVTLRLPKELVGYLDAAAKSEHRSRSQFITLRLQEWKANGNHDTEASGRSPSGTVERSGNGASMPVVRKAKGDSKRLHSVQPMRNELDARPGLVERSTHEGHLVLPNGRQNWCSTCGVNF